MTRPSLQAAAPSLRRNLARQVPAYVVIFRRVLRGTMFSGFVAPVLLLLGMGVALGGFIDRNATSGVGGAPSYLLFLAPGLLAMHAMQIAAFESSYPIVAGLKWTKFYHAMASTPLRVVDIVLGALGFVVVRLLIVTVVFSLVLLAFGAVTSWLWLLAIVAAVLVGAAHAAPTMAMAGFAREDSWLAMYFRLLIVPMGLFSGAFFPLSQLPHALQLVAAVLPLWHGVELVRGLALGSLSLAAGLLHCGYLLAWTVAGTRMAVRTFSHRLVR
ncbi:MAG TPA: ABC transporter permease [Propionibacteriaceae bacterium]|nr:ABC transporter permease [Propionibacteriaceae bacterium]